MTPGNIVLSLILWLGIAGLSWHRSAVTTQLKVPVSVQLIEALPKDTLDTLKKYKPERFPAFRPRYRWADPFSYRPSRSLFDLQPSALQREVRLDTSLRYFYIDERIGNLPYRYPTLLPYDTLFRLEEQFAEQEFWRREGGGVSEESTTATAKGFRPRIPVTNRLFGLIFGGDYIEFRPTGYVNLDFAYRSQRIANPAIPAARQRTGTFDFDPQANLNLTGQVGDKLRITTNFNTQASFDFENNFKVEYTGYPEEIIRKIEFGNVNFALPTSLIQGSQSLFGLKTELQFGRLRVQGVFSQKRSTADQISIQGGAQLRKYEICASNYDENRHFFLSHFHRSRYEPALRTLPLVNSGVLITRVEVYVTNRANTATGLRNIVAFTDLGEGNPYRSGNPFVGSGNPQQPASNNANQLFANLTANAVYRDIEQLVTALQAQGLSNGDDFTVLRSARKLEPNEYSFHPQLGYITLNTPLRNDEVLAVAFEYTYNGNVYRVGELSDDYLNRPESEAIFLKMLRPPAIRTNLPTWDLMMKNIYSLNASQIKADNFRLRVIYRDDLTGLDNPALHEGRNTKNVPLLKLFGLDELNPRGDRQIDAQGNSIGDGNFDFVEGLTINTAQGLIIFPVLEPFGKYLKQYFDPVAEAQLIDKYVFEELYKTTRNDAENNYANKNKFFLVGQYEGSSGSSVFLPGINVAQGSVIVKAGGIQLTEGTDYIVNYSTGQVTIINDAILASGKEITIEYEKADFFNLQTRTYMGARLDYALDRDVNIGATVVNLRERPILTRVAMGSEAINNTMIGADVSLKKESRFLTRLADALPLIQTKEKSSITFQAEVAQLHPGAARLSGAVSYIDDFEGTRTPFDLGRTANLRWKLGATPPQFIDPANPAPLKANYRRARLAWYNIDNTFFRSGVNGRPSNISDQDLQNHYMRPIVPQEIFPNRQFSNIVTNETTFDLAFFPDERGPYNFNPNLTAEGKLLNPTQNFGAITHAILNQVDFDNANVEYIEFWLLDPFISGERGRVIVDGTNGVNNTTGGELYFHLGTISEDVIPDSRHFFENGLPVTPEGSKDQTIWGYVPNQPFLVNAFSNEPGARALQDVGLDGVSNNEEATFYQSFLNSLPPAVRAAIEEDPSADNFRFYFDSRWDAQNAKIIERYKYYNNTENNSPENAGSGLITPAGTNLPDNEDLNQDNTLNDLDAYYEYRISLRPQDLVVGKNYIVDKVEVSDPNITKGDKVTWYQFRIPIREPDGKVGNIEGFKSIRFMRLVLTGFSQPAVLRMAQFQLVANQWRRYLGDLSQKGYQLPSEPYDPSFVLSTVNLEENAAIDGESMPYDLPPGAIRDRDVTSINNRELNEQSIQLCVQDLRDGDARAAFKNVNLNLLFYKRLKMYIHAHDLTGVTQDGEVAAIIRVGTDFTQNYYEIEVPLELTTLQEVLSAPTRQARQELIWKRANELDIALDELVATKVARNNERGFRKDVFIPYTRQVGNYRITVVGNPDLSAVTTLMLGIKNPKLSSGDDGRAKSVCVWFDEFRATGYEQTKGVAATSRLNLQMADFANISANAKLETFGFGGLNQRIYQRTLNNTKSFDVQANIALDKFFPAKAGLRIPLFVSYQRTNISPEYDPLDPDVKLDASLGKFDSDAQRRQYRQLVETNETRRSINFTNVRKLKTNPNTKPHLWDIANFAYSWSYSEIERSDMTTASYRQQRWRNALTYNFNFQPKPWEPFKNVSWMQSPWLRLLRDFNLIMQPTAINLRGELDRTFTRTQFRDADFSTFQFAPFYEKYYTFNRFYSLQFAFTKSLNLNYNADAFAIIDEPAGEIDTQANRDSVWANLRRLGRMKNFKQTVSANYKLPLDKLPLTDWLSADAAYTVNYQWQAASLGLEDSVGNVILNAREQSLRTRADLVKLYNKVKILNEINQTSTQRSQTKKDTTKKKSREILKAFLRPLMMLRNVNVNYSKQEGTTLPGFLPRPKYLGLDEAWQAPGWEFVLGSQNPDIRRIAAKNGWLVQKADTTGILLNQPFRQTMTENLTAQANLEPFQDFKIQLDAKRSRTVGYNEIYRYDPVTNSFRSLSPVRTGSYTVSTILIGTAFEKSDKELLSATFERFVANRQLIQQRLEAINPNSGSYDLNGQDVLVPAFVAAYSGQSAQSVSLAAFPALPLPNWRITYNGLSRLSFLKQWFNNIALSHNYTAEYQINNYTSSLRYQDESLIGAQVLEYNYLLPSALNDQGFYVPVYVLNGVRLSERFNPLIGVNLRTNSNLNLRLDYNKGRDITLNLSNTQVTESRSEDFIIGLGYTARNMKLPFRDSDRKPIVLKNDVLFRVDFAIRDTRTIQRRIGEENVFTAGNRNFQLRPNITYNVDQRLTFQVYFERLINTPRVSNAFVRKDTAFGFQLRYNFTQ